MFLSNLGSSQLFQELHDVSNFSWMPLLLFAIYIMIFNVGFGLIPWLLIGELLTNDRRNDASTATVTCAWALAFLVTKCFQDMLNLMGPSSSFAFFGMMSLLGTVFISVLIPEREEGGHVEDEPQIELHDVRNRRETETLAIQMWRDIHCKIKARHTHASSLCISILFKQYLSFFFI